MSSGPASRTEHRHIPETYSATIVSVLLVPAVVPMRIPLPAGPSQQSTLKSVQQPTCALEQASTHVPARRSAAAQGIVVQLREYPDVSSSMLPVRIGTLLKTGPRDGRSLPLRADHLTSSESAKERCGPTTGVRSSWRFVATSPDLSSWQKLLGFFFGTFIGDLPKRRSAAAA